LNHLKTAQRAVYDALIAIDPEMERRYPNTERRYGTDYGTYSSPALSPGDIRKIVDTAVSVNFIDKISGKSERLAPMFNILAKKYIEYINAKGLRQIPDDYDLDNENNRRLIAADMLIQCGIMTPKD
jgi:hypothetical protein